MKSLYELQEVAIRMRCGDYVVNIGYISSQVGKAVKEFEALECGYECGYTEPYGFVPEGGCPIHD